MTKPQTLSLVIFGFIVIMSAVAVKMIFFPSISDKYFSTAPNQLEAVPSGLVVIRPTHFKKPNRSPQTRLRYATVQGNTRMVGVNITFRRLIALAYNANGDNITLPWNAPTNQNFDVLVTAPGDVWQNLQAAIHRKLGFVADLETNETSVYALRVTDPSLQAFKISSDDEKANEDLKNGKLYITHMRLAELVHGMGEIFGRPVVDETGLTNYYDCSLVMTPQLQRMMRNGPADKDALTGILSNWGLDLEPDTASIGVLVVKKAD
ncbi:MAG: TIGR03435 family protein [Limisphaerales bacterium]